MSIHAEAMQAERLAYPNGRQHSDGTYYEAEVRVGKTRRDRESGATARRIANRAARGESSSRSRSK